MTDEPTDLDTHRGIKAQKETLLRRNLMEVQQDQQSLRSQQDELEHFLVATPATSWPEAMEKVRYLLGLFAQTPEAVDPRRRQLIDAALSDCERLLAVQPTDNDNNAP
jgi:hypothetical protein